MPRARQPERPARAQLDARARAPAAPARHGRAAEQVHVDQQRAAADDLHERAAAAAARRAQARSAPRASRARAGAPATTATAAPATKPAAATAAACTADAACAGDRGARAAARASRDDDAVDLLGSSTSVSCVAHRAAGYRAVSAPRWPQALMRGQERGLGAGLTARARTCGSA